LTIGAARPSESEVVLGARACLALARVVGAPAMTANRAWSGLDVGIEIRAIR
jgi:PIN domain nuclease of toxin-antitoxin system